MAQTKNYNLDYMIDAAFRNINRLFVLSFKAFDGNPFDKYYTTLVEIKYFNILVDNRPFFH